MLRAWSILLLAAGSAAAQNPLSFEVASVKPATLVPGVRPIFLNGGPGTKTPTRLSGIATMKMLLLRAYPVKSAQITSPAWTDTEFYDIDARVPPDATKEQVQVMLQTLLAERFHLTIRRETTEVPIYAMITGKNGPRLTESDPVAAAEAEKVEVDPAAPRPKVTMGPDGFPEIPPDTKIPRSITLSLASGEFTRYKLIARHQTMDQLADWIGEMVKRPVKNQTNLTGPFDFTLAFESEPLRGIPRTQPSENTEPGPTVFSAIQEQLGLKLEQRKGPVEMVIVERLDKAPTEN